MVKKKQDVIPQETLHESEDDEPSASSEDEPVGVLR